MPKKLSALEHVVFTRGEGANLHADFHGESVQAALVVRSIAFLRRNRIGRWTRGVVSWRVGGRQERNLNAAVEAEDDEVNRAEGWFCM